jgi:cytochrome c oxidase cbb3-type subunit III
MMNRNLNLNLQKTTTLAMATLTLTLGSSMMLHAAAAPSQGAVPGTSAGQYNSLRRFLRASNELMGGGFAAGTQVSGSGADAKSIEDGKATFQQSCAFCHGRDAGGGETGPDLTRSKLVAADKGGDRIGDVVRNGRIDKGMPKFNFGDTEMANVVTFIHSQATKAQSAKPGARKGVDVADLQTGNVEAGKAYFNGAGGCAACHSPTGDLAGIASKYQGLQLEERMLYPRDAKSTVSVTTASGQTIEGPLAYQDEFTVALRDAAGTYRSWPVSTVKYKVNSPADAHVTQFPKYTDADIHNLMAYIQTLK